MATDRAEHVAPHDGGADAHVAAGDESVIEAPVATVLADHLATGAGCAHPFVQSCNHPPRAVVEILVWSGRVAVERDRKVVDSDLEPEATVRRTSVPRGFTLLCLTLEKPLFLQGFGGVSSQEIARRVWSVPGFGRGNGRVLQS